MPRLDFAGFAADSEAGLRRLHGPAGELPSISCAGFQQFPPTLRTRPCSRDFTVVIYRPNLPSERLVVAIQWMFPGLAGIAGGLPHTLAFKENPPSVIRLAARRAYLGRNPP